MRSRLLIGLACLSAFGGCSSYVKSRSSHYEALFGATCGASVLICPRIQRQGSACQQGPMSSLFLLDVYDELLVEELAVVELSVKEPSPNLNIQVVIGTFDLFTGSTIDVKVEITADHRGFFEFKVCPNEDFSLDKTQDCFDRFLFVVDHFFCSY